jgi:hypothetical protein
MFKAPKTPFQFHNKQNFLTVKIWYTPTIYFLILLTVFYKGHVVFLHKYTFAVHIKISL